LGTKPFNIVISPWKYILPCKFDLLQCPKNKLWP